MRASLSLVLLVLVASLVLVEAAKKGKKGKKKPKKPTPYDKYTESSDCPCWYDMGAEPKCGCCKNGGVQCGFPKQAFCGEKSNKGCKGVIWPPTKDPNQLVLSKKGHPCYWDHSDLSCAWCKAGTYQCAQGKDLICATPKDGMTKKCDGVKADCGHFGKDICDINAECKEGKGWNKGLYACRCKPGWTGNGLQCVDKNGEFGENPNKIVDLEMTLTNDFIIANSEEGVYPYGPSQDNLFSVMSGMFEGSPACNGCNATMINLSAPVE